MRGLRLVSYEYDSAGNLSRGVDYYKHAFSFRYDRQNRLVTRTDRSGYSFHFEYDTQGRCTRARGQDGLHDVQLRYMSAERVTVVTKSDGGQWTYFDDLRERLTQIIDPYGGRTAFQLGTDGLRRSRNRSSGWRDPTYVRRERGPGGDRSPPAVVFRPRPADMRRTGCDRKSLCRPISHPSASIRRRT